MIDNDDEQQVGAASGSDKEGGVACGSDDGEEPVMSDKLRQLLAKVCNNQCSSCNWLYRHWYFQTVK
jgi:hypothetical protein